MSGYLSTAEAAKRMGVPPSRVHDLCERGLLPGALPTDDNAAWHIPVQTIEAWRAQQPAHPENASDQPTRLKWWARVRRHPLIFYPAIVVTVVMVVIAFGQALGLNPDDAEVYYNRGIAYRH